MPFMLTVILVLGLAVFTPNVFCSELGRVLNDADRSLVDRERDIRSRPDVIISLLNLKPGDQVADIFAGTGYYSELLGSVVGARGTVLLHNNAVYNAFSVKGLDERFVDGRPGNIQLHVAEADNLMLGDGKLDAVIMVLAYHDLYFVNESDGWHAIDVNKFLSQIFTSLKPGGRFLIIDHAARSGGDKSTAQTLHRIDPDFARRDIESHGFELIASSDVLENRDDNHLISVFDPSVRGQTDRFILVFGKPIQPGR